MKPKSPKETKTHLRVAIVHDWLVGGGAELVVESIHQLYPKAPIYTSYCSDEWRQRLNNQVVTGYLQKWPFSRLRKFLPLLRILWFRSLDLSKYDLIVSSSGNGEAKHITKPQHAVHVNYCHSPVHFYWRKHNEYLESPGFRPKWLVRLGLKLLVSPLRKLDYAAAQKVDHFIANSTHIQNDIKTYYDRESTVIHPPVNTATFAANIANKERGGFIIWGRHVPYKRFDLAIKACNRLKLPLVIAGTGPETANLQQIAGPSIRFVGKVPYNELAQLASSAEAFIFPGEEDFGITPVEAMAAGTPVIAYKSGGALDYVIDGKTGTFFKKQTVDSLSKAMNSFTLDQFNSRSISKHAHEFDQKLFSDKLEKELQKIWRK